MWSCGIMLGYWLDVDLQGQVTKTDIYTIQIGSTVPYVNAPSTCSLGIAARANGVVMCTHAWVIDSRNK